MARALPGAMPVKLLLLDVSVAPFARTSRSMVTFVGSFSLKVQVI